MSKAMTVLWKDLLIELRSKEIVTSVLVFALLVIVIFNFAFEPGPDRIGVVAPGVLWVSFTFAGMLGLNRAFLLEKEKGCLEGLLMCPVSREAIFVGKMLTSLLFMLIVEAVIFPVFSVLLNLPLFMPRLYLIALLASVGFAAVGSLFSALAVNTKAREFMLPLLFFPIVVPVVIAAVQASGAVIEGKPWSSFVSWLQVLAAFDVVFLVVSALVFEYAVEE